MKKDEYVCDCSDIDDVIVFTKDGKYLITKVSEKAYFEKDIYYIGTFKKNDDRTIYNIIYRDGKNGPIMMKRCAIKGITRDKVYDITKGSERSEILYMSLNRNGEAEVLKVYFKPRPRLKKLIVDLDFSTLAIKNRQSQGNLFSRYGIHKVQVKTRGVSTLGGQNIWFDPDIRRLNTEGRGQLLGEFKGNDKILVVTSSGRYYTTGFDVGQHFPEDMMRIERLYSGKVYSVTYFDAEQEYFYVKRFVCELSEKPVIFIDENPGSYMVEFNDDRFPQLEVVYGGKYSTRPAERIDVEEFIGVKGVKAKGKRITTNDTESIKFIEPLEKDPVEEETIAEEIDSFEQSEPEQPKDEREMVQQELF
jgi:topoisomerase-4 subunit A